MSWDALWPSLGLTGTQLSDAGMTALVRCGDLSGLRDLHAAGNAIGDQGVQLRWRRAHTSAT